MRIFGSGVTLTNISALGQKVNIPASTLYYWRKHPDCISLYGFARIAKAKGMTDEQLLKVIRGIK
jgi:hypothetical protein